MFAFSLMLMPYRELLIDFFYLQKYPLSKGVYDIYLIDSNQAEIRKNNNIKSKSFLLGHNMESNH